MLLKKNRGITKLPEGDVNVVSLMDILTTLLFFILLITSFTKLSKLSGSFLKTSHQKADKNTFSLQVKFQSSKSATVWLGPLTDLKIMQKDDLNKYLKDKFKGKEDKGYSAQLSAANFKSLLEKVQDTLITIKKSFPHEHQVVATYHDDLHYQEVIDSMNALRTLPEGKDSFEVTNFINHKANSKVLFPRVLLGED